MSGKLGRSHKRWNTLFLVSAFSLAVVLRLIVVSTPPRFYTASDSGEYVSFARELIANHFAIPKFNTLYYPGSPWIYPPIAIEFFAMLVWLTRASGWTPFYLLTAIMVVIDSLTIIPVFLVSKRVFNEFAAVVAVLIYAAYPPDLYALTWSGYPQIIATFLLGWIIYYFLVTVDSPNWGSPINIVSLGLITGILALTHDLTIFVVFFTAMFYCVFVLLRNVRVLVSSNGPQRRNVMTRVFKIVAANLIALPFFAYWYLPRWQWVMSAASVMPGAGEGLISVITNFFSSIIQPLGPFYDFPIIFAVLLLFSLYLMGSKRNGKAFDVVFSFLVAPILLILVEHGNGVLSARLSYYIFFPALILVAYSLSSVVTNLQGLRLKAGRLTKFNGGDLVSRKKIDKPKMVAYGIVFVLVALNAIGTVSFNMTSHTYYDKCFSCDATNVLITNLPVLAWIHQNIPNHAVFAVAGDLGYYVSAYDGNPAIVYHSLQYLTQQTERQESLAAYFLVYEASTNLTLAWNYIHYYNVSYVIVYNSPNTTLPYFYQTVYSDNQVSVLRISTAQVIQS
jgi:hypothetical protein